MTPSTRDNNPAQICAEVTQEEWARWESLEAVKDETGTWAMRGKPILTRKYLMSLARWFHDKIHRDITTIVNQIEKNVGSPWNTHGSKKDCAFLSHMLEVI